MKSTNPVARRTAVVLCGVLAWSAVACNAAWAAERSDCDRGCLKAQVDEVLAAIVKHDPARVPVTSDHQAIYNGKPGRLADMDIWKNIDGFVFHQYVMDTANRQVAFYGVATEAQRRGIFFMRLVRERGKIALIEVTAGARKLDGVPGLISPNTFYDYVLPASERVSRKELARLADDYFEALEKHDGSRIPIVEGCRRFEDGVLTSPNPYMLPTCISFTHATYIDATSNRIYPVIDEERGLVLGQMVIQASKPPSMGPPPGGASVAPGYRPNPLTGMVLSPGAHFMQPHDTIIHQLFKIVGGKVAEMQTYRLDCEYGWGGGWLGERKASDPGQGVASGSTGCN
jgi:hypothetical protein